MDLGPLNIVEQVVEAVPDVEVYDDVINEHIPLQTDVVLNPNSDQVELTELETTIGGRTSRSQVPCRQKNLLVPKLPQKCLNIRQKLETRKIPSFIAKL